MKNPTERLKDEIERIGQKEEQKERQKVENRGQLEGHYGRSNIQIIET